MTTKAQNIELKIDGKLIRFTLEATHAGVDLKATHVDGVETASGYLLRIRQDGTFTRHTGVSERFGFKLNTSGSIKKPK